MSKVLRIVPADPLENGVVPANPTRVFTASGEEVRGITKIVLIAEVNNVWRAEITCNVTPPDITCLSDVSFKKATSLWRRIVNRFWYGA